MRRNVRRLGVGVVLVVVIVAVTMPVWKPAAKRLKWFVVATNVYQDTLRRVGLSRAQIGQPEFAALPDSEVPSYIARIDTTFGDYQRYGQLTAERVRGTRVLEIGPGETLGVALRLASLGAAQVTAVDKFVPLQTSPFHQRLYRTLETEFTPDEQRNVADAVDLNGGVKFNPARISYVYGQGIEDAGARLAPGSFDFVISNAVLEEVYDLDRMFDAIDHLLKPGGRQVHNIDLRDYGMFSKYGFHPLEFLTIPDGIYRYMVEASGQPNRRLLDYYQHKMASLGYRATFYRTWVLGGTARLREYPTELRYGRDYGDDNLRLLESIRPRLLPRYRSLPDEVLLTESILLVADKPASARRIVATGN